MFKYIFLWKMEENQNKQKEKMNVTLKHIEKVLFILTC